MSRREITDADIDALLKFLPGFERAGREFATWRGGGREGEALTLPYPDYDGDVLEFFGLAGQECWCDFGYRAEEAWRMLGDEEALARAGLEEVKSMLTFCVRSERFGDGNWQSLLKEGRVAALLRRLAAVRAGAGP
ncbi:MAG TPA: DUF6508 domain-containing protein [Pyrinomonadaceae bacterium]|nr:DUF6508 domain-containing protein [Pyrinomonadaceae bacterium]